MELDSWQRDQVNNYSGKFCKGGEVLALHINIKGHMKAGGRMSYTTQLRAEVAHGIKTAESTDWDFHASVKTAFGKLEREVKARPKGLLRKLGLRRGDRGF
jgi:ribosome-associated translation inhibitor RaiA